MVRFCSFFNGWVIFRCLRTPHLLYPFIYWWALRLIPCLILQVKRQWICCFKFMFLFSSCKYSEVKLVDYMAALFYLFYFFTKLSTVFHSGCTNLYPCQQCTKVSFCSVSLPTLVIRCLLIIVTLTDVSWYLIVVFICICISLMISDIEHFFIYLLAVLCLLWKMIIHIFC